MLFAETEKKNSSIGKYEYKCIDVFGELKITSIHRLDAEMLDTIAMKALKDTPLGETNGIKWHLRRKDAWEEVVKTAKEELKVKKPKFSLKNMGYIKKNRKDIGCLTMVILLALLTYYILQTNNLL